MQHRFITKGVIRKAKIAGLRQWDKLNTIVKALYPRYEKLQLRYKQKEETLDIEDHQKARERFKMAKTVGQIVVLS